MSDFLAAFIVLGLLFALIDAVWLKGANKLYQKEIGGLLLGKPNMPAAILFYVIYISGVVAFVIVPALNVHDILQVVYMGGLFGLIAYATYDLTNLATLKKWSTKITVIDILWGIFITAISSTITYLILTTWFGK